MEHSVIVCALKFVIRMDKTVQNVRAPQQTVEVVIKNHTNRIRSFSPAL
jgi:hypothetical protein